MLAAAATRFSPVTVLAAAAGMRGAEAAFLGDVAARLEMRSAVALTSLMRNTWAAIELVRRRRPEARRVLLPRYACPSFLHGIVAAGLEPAYCDLEAETLAITPALVDAARTADCGALLVPNLFGLASDMEALAAWARAHDLVLIEGADYSFGGRFAGRPLGSFGDVTILNFQEGKALPIGGGMVLAREPGALDFVAGGKHASSLVAGLRSLAFSVLIRPMPYGVVTRLLGLAGLAKQRLSMEDTIRETTAERDFRAVGARLDTRIAPFQAALGRRLLATLPEQAGVRRQNAARLEAALAGTPHVRLVRPHPRLEGRHDLRLPLLVGDGLRDGLRAHLLARGVEASSMYVDLGMRVEAERFPGAARVAAELLTLPTHPFVGKAGVDAMAVEIRRFLGASVH